MKYLFIDTETGGTNPFKHSLLSIGLVVWSTDLGILDKREFFVKNSEYVVTREAAKINGFLQEVHNSKSEPPRKIIKDFKEFVAKHFPDYSKVTVVGHNIQFDVNFLKEFFKKNGYSFLSIVSHRMIDTNSILKYLVLSGKLPESINNLTDALRYFNIKIEDRHSALDDCEATAILFEKLIKYQN